jgi:hypothetical protein
MAQKVNPISVRLNLNRSSDSSWFSDYYYGKLLYQDLNFRDYFGSIRPPAGNTFGFRLSRCIIHHFPKKTFIHLSFLDRLSQSRHQGLGALPSVRSISRINDDTVRDRNEVGIWPKKRRYEYHGRSPSMEKIDQLLRVSDWMADIDSTFLSIWPKEETDDGRASEERYAFSRFAPSILVAARAEKKKNIFGDFFGFTGRASLDYFVMQYFFNLKNQIQFDPMVNRSPVAQSRTKTSMIGGAITPAARGRQTGESIRQSGSTLYFDAIMFLRYARFRKATSLSSRYYYLKKMQSLFSDQTKTNTLIQPVKIASVYRSASLIAQEISWKLEQKKSFRQICRSIFKQIKKCTYVKGIRIGCSGRLNGAEIAKTEYKKYGETSLHVFSDQIDYAKTQASTPYGILGVKVWVSYFLTKKKGTSCAISKTYKIS